MAFTCQPHPRSSAFAGVSVPPIGAPDGEPICCAVLGWSAGGACPAPRAAGQTIDRIPTAHIATVSRSDPLQPPRPALRAISGSIIA